MVMKFSNHVGKSCSSARGEVSIATEASGSMELCVRMEGSKPALAYDKDSDNKALNRVLHPGLMPDYVQFGRRGAWQDDVELAPISFSR